MNLSTLILKMNFIPVPVSEGAGSALTNWLNWYDAGSVVDPNTLNLDPDPGNWPNLDPDPG